MTVQFPDSMHRFEEFFRRLEKGRYDVFLSPTFFRTFNCLPNCGACCLKTSLDYPLKEEQKKLKESYPEIYEKYFKYRTYKKHSILSDLQEDNPNNYCRFLDSNGRCQIHSVHPLGGRMEPIKFRLIKDRVYVMKSFFGRSWNLTQINGEKGCLCSFTDYTKKQFQNDIQILKEFNDVANFFNIETVLPQIINILEKKYPITKLETKIPIQIIKMEQFDKWE